MCANSEVAKGLNIPGVIFLSNDINSLFPLP